MSYAGQNVECLSIALDPTQSIDHAWIDNATGIVCEETLVSGSSTTHFILVSWVDQDLSMYREMVHIGDNFLWNVSYVSAPSNYVILEESILNETANTTVINQTTYNPITGSYETNYPDFRSDLIYSKSSLNILNGNASLNPKWVPKTYANKSVTCLNFAIDTANYGWIDNNTGALCEFYYDPGGGNALHFLLISWTNQGFPANYSVTSGNILGSIPGYPLVILAFFAIASFGITLRRKKKSISMNY